MLDFDINAYLRLKPSDMLIICISTLLIVWLAKHFFWDKVLGFLDARQAAIQADIDAGAKDRADGEAYKAQYEAKLSDVKIEARVLIESAKASANQEKRDILASAHKEADDMKAKTRKELEREKAAAKDEMKEAIVEVAFEAAKQIVNKELDEKAHKQYVDEFIDHAGDESWQA